MFLRRSSLFPLRKCVKKWKNDLHIPKSLILLFFSFFYFYIFISHLLFFTFLFFLFFLCGLLKKNWIKMLFMCASERMSVQTTVLIICALANVTLFRAPQRISYRSIWITYNIPSYITSFFFFFPLLFFIHYFISLFNCGVDCFVNHSLSTKIRNKNSISLTQVNSPVPQIDQCYSFAFYFFRSIYFITIFSFSTFLFPLE